MNVILGSIKRSLRDKNTMISLIFLSLILPYVFSLIFSFEGKVEDINVKIVGDKNSQITKEYTEFLEEADKNDDTLNLEYKVVSNKEDTKENSKVKKDSPLVISIDEDKKVVNFEGSNTLNKGEIMIQGLTEEFFNTMEVYNTIASIGKTPQINQNAVKVNEYKGFVDKSTSTEDIDYGAYFSVVMLQMGIMMCGIHAFKNTFYLKENIGKRVKSAPMKISKLLTLELVGSFLVIFAESLIILIAITLVYNVNITYENIGPILLLQGVLSLFSISIGILTTAICKKKILGENVCSIIITVITLASGALMPNIANDIEKISILKINPFTWISSEFNYLIQNNTSENLLSAIGAGLIGTAIFMVVSILILRRKVVK